MSHPEFESRLALFRCTLDIVRRLALFYLDDALSYEFSVPYAKFERELDYIGYPNHCVHAGPIIRQEQEYRFESMEVRQKIMKKMMSFLRQVDIKCKTIYIEKKHISDEVEAAGKLAKQLSHFLRENLSIFASYDTTTDFFTNQPSDAFSRAPL